MVPMFDYSKIVVESEHPKKAKTTTIAILNKTSDGKVIQDAATPGGATPSVLYLSKPNSPPVTTTKPALVKCVTEGSKSQVNFTSSMIKTAMCIRADTSLILGPSQFSLLPQLPLKYNSIQN